MEEGTLTVIFIEPKEGGCPHKNRIRASIKKYQEISDEKATIFQQDSKGRAVAYFARQKEKPFMVVDISVSPPEIYAINGKGERQ
jgi:predicted RNA-binding protein